MIEKKFSSFDFLVVLLCVLVSVFFLIPLLFVISNAFSDPLLVYRGKVGLLPIGITFNNILEVFKEDSLILGFKNTIFYTVVGTTLQVVLQFSVAYPLSRKDLKFKTFWNFFFSIPMFVSGGMIPTYLVVKGLGLLNTSWAIIIPGCVGLYNVIIIRTYLSTAIPYSLTEAAMLDGCGPIKTFFYVVFPLCKPIFCVMILYGVVGYWNAYFNSIIYTSDDKYWPLQRVLSRMLVKTQSSGSIGSAEYLMRAEGMKYAIILVSSLPLLVMYPFFQKYFEKGMMVGSIKG